MAKVAVLMGGMSAEREVSMQSGTAVAETLRGIGHDVVEVDVGRDLPLVLAREAPDVAFMALHGRGGEDGTVQGLLEIMRIPYTGCGVLSSAVTIDKIATKQILAYHGLPLAPDITVVRGTAPEEARAVVEEELGYPVMVKPATEGSSIGVSRADDGDQLEAALADGLEHDDRALVEQFVQGRLLTVGVLGDKPAVLPVLEIKTSEGFYDFRAKYEPGYSQYEVPAALDEPTTVMAQRLALESFRVLWCEGVARIDFILDESEQLLLLEVNTIPGMTATSLLPKAAAAVGIGFSEVVSTILAGARLKVDLEG